VAYELTNRYRCGEKVVLTCGYTPASSRSGYCEEKSEKKSGGVGEVVGSRNDGVEVRSRPVEYGTALTETLFACTAPSMSLVDEGVSTNVKGGGVGKENRDGYISELAAHVASGGIVSDLSAASLNSKVESSSQQQQRRRIVGVTTNNGTFIGPCPPLGESLLQAWDPLVSLSQSMSYQACSCCETSYMEMGGPYRISWGEEIYATEAAHSTSECLRVIYGVSQHPNGEVAEYVFDSHLMQLLCVATCALTSNVEDEPENNVKSSQELLNILVDVALNHINLCQRLFFLLRCFIGVLEGQVSDEAAKSLKLLRYAQRRLSGRMFDKSESHDANRHCSEGYPINREVSSTSSLRKVSQLDMNIALSESEENHRVITPGAPVNHRQNGTASSSLRLDNSDSGECVSMDNLSCMTPASTVTANSNDGVKKKKVKSLRQLWKGGKSKSLKKGSSFDGQLPPSAGIARTLKQGSSFSFTNVFHKQSTSSNATADGVTPSGLPQAPSVTMSLSMSQKFENLTWILRRIDTTCAAIDKNLIKSFPQKMADLALRPWSASKESALASITQSFQADLRGMNSDSPSNSHFPILNPMDTSEQLTSVDADECFILPSAHFPMLLCFNSIVSPSSPKSSQLNSSEERCFTLYRTTVKFLGLKSTVPLSQKANGSGEAYVVQGAVGGVVQESGAR
jgi:hypothetical protein